MPVAVSFMERSYLGIIADVKVSDTYAAVLSEGKVELHQVTYSLLTVSLSIAL